MKKIKEILKNLNILDTIKQSFNSNDIEPNDDNLKSAGFGFHTITESFDSTVILTEEVGKFVDRVRELQQTEYFEQPFILLGMMQLDEEGKPIFLFHKFIEDTDSFKSKYFAHIGIDLITKINDFLRSTDIANKVVLLGHTHPLVNAQRPETTGDKAYSILSNLEGNPLKLRDRGLNISVADVRQLVQVSESIGSHAMVLQGIALANGELNIIFYDGSTIKSLDNVFDYQNNEMIPRPNYRSDSAPTITKK